MTKKIFYLIVGLSVFSLLFPFNGISAATPKDTLTIQTIWVTGNKSCFNNDWQRLEEYQRDLILPYLKLYGLEPITQPLECMNQTEYEVYETPDYTDLLIVIYNKNIGRDILHSNNLGGYFLKEDIFSKSGLRIEVCECPSFEHGDPVWVISHELNHFALFYLGFPQEIWLDWVHIVEAVFDENCPEGYTNSASCDGLWREYRGESRDFKVMEVYQEALGKTPPRVKFVNYLNSDFFDLETKTPLTDQQIQYFNKRITNTTFSLLNIQQGFLESYNAINNSYEQNLGDESKVHTDKAMGIYLDLIKSLEDQFIGLQNIENQFSFAQIEENYPNVRDDAYEVLTQNLNDVNLELEKIGANMRFISQELDFAAKAHEEIQVIEEKPEITEEKNCFWFFCI